MRCMLQGDHFKTGWVILSLFQPSFLMYNVNACILSSIMWCVDSLGVLKSSLSSPGN